MGYVSCMVIGSATHSPGYLVRSNSHLSDSKIFAIQTRRLDRTMALTIGKVLVGAFASVAVGTLAISFCANAAASTGTGAPRQDGQLVQYAQEEHHELKEKTESKVDELKGDAAAVPNAVEQSTRSMRPTKPTIRAPKNIIDSGIASAKRPNVTSTRWAVR